MNEPIESFLSRLHGVCPISGGWQACCPAHDDRNASLSVSEGDNGRVLVHCHAGCTVEQITEALGISVKDLFLSDNGNGKRGCLKKGKLIATYNYTETDGTLSYQVCRYDPKRFVQRRPDSKGGWVYNLKGVKPLIYRLPQVISVIKSGCDLFIVEGEKDVESLEQLGLVATCNSGGAGKFPSSQIKHFSGARVMILPDNDEAGKKHALQVAAMLNSQRNTDHGTSRPFIEGRRFRLDTGRRHSGAVD